MPNDYFSRTLYSTYGDLGGPARPFGWPGPADFVRDAQKSVHGAQEKAVGVTRHGRFQATGQHRT